MSEASSTAPGAAARLSPQLAARKARLFLDAIERLPPLRTIGILVVANWIAVLSAALVVRHAGWIYYQGGDQLWLYTEGWLLSHGELTRTVVGYLWPSLLSPVAAAAGPNLAAAFPAIAVLNVLVLTPIAMFALYGIAARIGGRIMGYWALLLWILLPFVGILYTNDGYHQRYTELLLPQAFGLTAMADFPTTVAVLVAAYFCSGFLVENRPRLFDGAAAGVAAGAAIGLKPASVLFLVGPALLLVACRQFRALAAMGAGMVPAVLTLAMWKARGLGSIPLLSSLPHRVEADVAAAAPIAGLNLDRYLSNQDWSHLGWNIDLLREHFWSGRLIVWLVIAGTIGLFRASPRAALLIGGWFYAFVFVKGTYVQAGVEDGSLFRIMMPSYPAFVLLLASVPLLFPHAPRLLSTWRPAFASPARRTRWTLLGAALLITAVIPFGAIAAASTSGTTRAASLNATAMPTPVNVDLGLTGRTSGRRVELSWKASRPPGSPVFYRVWRARGDGFSCPQLAGAPLCNITMQEVGVTREPAFVDRAPRGRWMYRIAIAANWLNDPGYGDPYVVSRPLTLAVK